MISRTIKILTFLFVLGVYALVVASFVAALCASIVYGSEKTIVLNPYSTVSLRGYIDDDTVAKTIDNIIRNENETIYFVIDSPGGNVEAGLKLIDTMKSSGKRFICISADAASMAFSILQTCDVRYVTQSAVLMQHVGGYSVKGDAAKNKSITGYIERLLRKLNQNDAKRLGVSVSQFESMIRDDMWLLGAEAVAVHAADGVVNVRCTKSLADQRIVEKTTLSHSEITIVMSGCPLVSEPLSFSIETKSGSTATQSDEEISKLDYKFHNHKYFGQNPRKK